MTQGYVIFNTQAEFDAVHQAEREALGYDLTGTVQGVPAPQNQRAINITSAVVHPTPGDNRVVAYINGGWRDSAKAGFVFNTLEEVKAMGWFQDGDI